MENREERANVTDGKYLFWYFVVVVYSRCHRHSIIRNLVGLCRSLEAPPAHAKSQPGSTLHDNLSPLPHFKLFRDKIAYTMRWAYSQKSWRWTSGSIQSAATGALSSVGPAALTDLRKPTIFSDAILAMLKANQSRQWPLGSRQEFPHDSCTSTIIELIIPKGSPAYVNRVIGKFQHHASYYS